MAFKQISDYTHQLAAEYKKADAKNDERSFYKSNQILECMTMYYYTVLSMPKFKGQKDYFKQVLKDIAPAYAKGLFKD